MFFLGTGDLPAITVDWSSLATAMAVVVAAGVVAAVGLKLAVAAVRMAVAWFRGR